MAGLKAGKYATRELIVQTIEEHGPLCSLDIAKLTGRSVGAVKGAVLLMRRCTPKLLRIVDWKRSLGTRGALGAVWCTSPGKDVEKPPPLGRKTVNAIYRNKHRAKLRVRCQARRGVVNPYLQLIQGTK
jgi:hypothetical protein